MTLCVIASLFVLPTKAIAEPSTYKPHIKVYAFEQVLEKWGSEEWDAFDKVIAKESSWKSEAQNPTSTAYGLGQLLNSTWGSVGCVKTSDPYVQIDCTIKYIEQRYETPKKALKFHYSNNWY